MKIMDRAAALVVACTLSSCTMLPVSRGEPPQFTSPTVRSAEEDRFPHWPMPPHELESLVASGDMRVLEVGSAGGGTTGAVKLKVVFPDHDRSASVKWKPMVPPRWVDVLPFAPGMLDGINNSPRRELAAWKIQPLFLDPEDYVVPESVVYCATLQDVPAEGIDFVPTLEESDCVLGLLSMWMKNVELPEQLFDLDRFRRDPVYAHYLANFNLLAYLIKHHDGREGNFLGSQDDSRRQVFAIDNGVAFGGIFYNWFVPNWSDIRVSALRKESVDRLREVTEADLTQALGVVAELRLDEEGIFRNVDPGPNLDDDSGVRYENGTLQFGLTEEEIDDIWERIEDLLEDVDEADLAVF